MWTEGVKIRAKADAASRGRQSAWITAEDRSTHRILRCELFVDHISRIEVLTTTRKMYKDDTERLDIQAFDKVGNIFSTLEGLGFDWAIREEKAQAASILKVVPFKDSGLETSDTLKEMEDSGEQTSAILVSGVQTGRVTVSARLVDVGAAFGESSLDNSVIISVLEPLALSPSHDIYLAPKMTATFLLQTFKRNEVLTIPMPNKSYK
eukprot:TRINITY_DN9248_c0_g1_i1.p1 TRINITY_DN9248_c0_g1~~TRINITY_DN9248_c0_g1_i1.p1  ORF type:complete len:208 (-),score=56.56 TRINITY_DN9248_c0_g1_i1:323-946(-)